MTQIITAQQLAAQITEAPEPFAVEHAPYSIAWEEFGGADEIDPSYDQDPLLDAVAYQQWAEAQDHGDDDWEHPVSEQCRLFLNERERDLYDKTYR
jgi:hypothetical protein